MSSYSELIKNFERIRAYMREFYVYGFKSRDDYSKKSARSYDDERRRIESWLGDHMSFVRTSEGKNVFISIDSRNIRHNPFYNAWKAKSFTDGDVTLHFILFDILHEPSIKKTIAEILEEIDTKYLAGFESPMMFDESTVRKKLKEYCDPRIKLFGVEIPGLEDVEPLFTQKDYHVYDKYSDGDPFEDEEYIRQFRVILEAMRKGTQIKFEMTNRFGKPMFIRCHPVRLEYSEKDDKFRLVTAGWRSVSTVNLAKIRACVHYTGEKPLDNEVREKLYDIITLKVTDERNALERVMLHFAHFEKQAEKLDKNTYLLKIKYAHDDEPEMVIRILSFGPLVEVIGSENFKKLVIEKLKKQKSCGLK